MENNKKRYVVTMDMYVYADNDYMARKRSHELVKNQNDLDTLIKISEIGEQPFGSLYYRKLEDHSEVRGKMNDEPLPF
tara:strand:+ start:191 stop:424 length:234 start_codon:yes stop_codon:yes gene_type:complete